VLCTKGQVRVRVRVVRVRQDKTRQAKTRLPLCFAPLCLQYQYLQEENQDHSLFCQFFNSDELPSFNNPDAPLDHTFSFSMPSILHDSVSGTKYPEGGKRVERPMDEDGNDGKKRERNRQTPFFPTSVDSSSQKTSPRGGSPRRSTAKKKIPIHTSIANELTFHPKINDTSRAMMEQKGRSEESVQDSLLRMGDSYAQKKERLREAKRQEEADEMKHEHFFTPKINESKGGDVRRQGDVTSQLYKWKQQKDTKMKRAVEERQRELTKEDIFRPSLNAVSVALCSRVGHAEQKPAHDRLSLTLNPRQDKTRQDKTRQDKTRQDKTRQDKTRQDQTRQDKDQDKTRQG
jgi:hypothetical protein